MGSGIKRVLVIMEFPFTEHELNMASAEDISDGFRELAEREGGVFINWAVLEDDEAIEKLVEK